MKKSRSKKKIDEPSLELERAIREAKEQGNTMIENGRDATREGQHIVDLSDGALTLLKDREYAPDVENLIPEFQNLGRRIAKFNTYMAENAHLVSSSTGTVTVAIVQSLVDSPRIIPSNPGKTPPTISPATTAAIRKLMRVLSRKGDVSSLLTLMQKYGLDVRALGEKSPVELIQIGVASFEGPINDDNPSSTSLIPIRDAINLSIEKLLRQRPSQEEAKSQYAKIKSIGTQLKYDDFTIEEVESWANQWIDLNKNYLSSSKTQNITREEWENRMNETFTWFKSFLEGLDPQKFRIPPLNNVICIG